MNKLDKYINRLLIVLIIIFINIFSLYVFKRFDLTKAKAYSLSKASKNILNNLDEPVRIRLFFSKNLPGHLNNVRNYSKDLLQEYQTYSTGKIQFEFINPDSEEKFKIEAERANIAPFSIEVYEKDKVEYRDVYLGASVVYKKSNKLIPLIQNTEGLEFIITNTIKELTKQRLRHIAYFQPLTHNERSNEKQLPIPDNIRSLYSIISRTSIMDITDLFTPLPDLTDLLIINAVKDSLHFVQLYNIDQFLMQGKPVLIFQDRYLADLNIPNAILFDNNLLDMLRFHGIFVKPALVMDANCFQVTSNRMQNGMLVPLNFHYPFFPMIQSFSDSLTIHNNLKWVQTYYSSEIHYGRRDFINNIPMLYTSPLSFEIAGFEIAMDYRKYQNIDFFTVFNHNPKPIANLFKGHLKSYFADKEVRMPGFIHDNKNALLFVAGSTSLLNNELLINVPDNVAFIQNLIDYLTNHEDFIHMRNRNITYSPLKQISNKEKSIFKYLNLSLPFIIIMFFALCFTILFKKHKNKIKKLIK